MASIVILITILLILKLNGIYKGSTSLMILRDYSLMATRFSHTPKLSSLFYYYNNYYMYSITLPSYIIDQSTRAMLYSQVYIVNILFYKNKQFAKQNIMFLPMSRDFTMY